MSSDPALKRIAARTARYRSVEDMLAGLDPSYPVYCIHDEVLRARARRFIEGFPGHVLFAIKCNPHPLVLRALYEGGVRHFDTASLPEIAQIAEMFADATCYFHHPVKSRAAIEAAETVYGLRHYVVDHADELDKVSAATARDDHVILVRMATPKASTAYDLSTKFGATPEETARLLGDAAARGYRTGLAFHVGSQCTDPAAFGVALDIARSVLAKSGVAIDYLDVGGGFPAAYEGFNLPPLEAYFDAIKAGVAAIDLPDHCILLCEPGRALVADGVSVITQIQLRKGEQLYINDGIYQSFSEMIVGKLRVPARLIPRGRDETVAGRVEFGIFGATCDSMDLLPFTYELPADAAERDWIEFGRMGAYSNAATTRFNGFFADTYIEIDESWWSVDLD